MKKKNCLSETIRPIALIFGLKHHLIDLYQVCTNYAPGAKNGPASGVIRDMVSAFNRYLNLSCKQNSDERFRASWSYCFKINFFEKIFQLHYQCPIFVKKTWSARRFILSQI